MGNVVNKLWKLTHFFTHEIQTHYSCLKRSLNATLYFTILHLQFALVARHKWYFASA